MDFNQAVRFVLAREGGLCRDTGGLTKFGISQRAYPELDIAGLTRGDAIAIYRRDYWDRMGAGELEDKLRLPVMDCAVNQGCERARNFLARSGGDCDRFMALRRQHYTGLAHRDPAKYGKYLHGWLNRLALVEKANTGGVSPPLAGPGTAEEEPRLDDQRSPSTFSIDDLWPKAWFKSKITWLSGLLGGSSVVDEMSKDDVTQGLFVQLVHRPTFWVVIVIVLASGAIIYFRWRDHGRGAT